MYVALTYIPGGGLLTGFAILVRTPIVGSRMSLVVVRLRLRGGRPLYISLHTAREISDCSARGARFVYRSDILTTLSTYVSPRPLSLRDCVPPQTACQRLRRNSSRVRGVGGATAKAAAAVSCPALPSGALGTSRSSSHAIASRSPADDRIPQ